MNQATQPVKGRASVLTAVAIAVAVVASLALAKMASAAENPVAAGSKTTITLNSGLVTKLKKAKVKLSGIAPATVTGGKTVTLPIEAGKLDTAGAGELEHEGGIKFKAGKKSVSVSRFVLVTSSSSLNAKVGSKTIKFASVTGLSAAREGFGTDVSIKSLKLTGKAAQELNKKLGLTGKSKKKGKRASASKKKSKAPAPVFKGNQVFGSSVSTTQPKTLGVQAKGTANLSTNEESVKKFVLPPPNGFGVMIEPIAPTELETVVNPFTPVLKFPITGGTIAPNGQSGVPQTSGGAKLVQNLGPSGESVISLANIWVDLSTLRATAEVTVSSTVSPQLNLGSLGRASIANLDISGATIKVDEAAKTITVENAKAVIEETTAEVMNKVFGSPLDAAMVPHPTFKAGDSLGTFSFTATTE